MYFGIYHTKVVVSGQRLALIDSHNENLVLILHATKGI